MPLTPFEQDCKDAWPVQPSVPIPRPLPLSEPSPPLDSPRLVTEAPTVFHSLPRDEGNVTVSHSLAGHSNLRSGLRTILSVERGFVSGFEQLETKAAGAGILPRDSRGR